jgi:hypothetical protein
MQHAPAVGVVDGVADVGESPQLLAQLQRPLPGVVLEGLIGVEVLDGLLERIPRMNRMA